MEGEKCNGKQENPLIHSHQQDKQRFNMVRNGKIGGEKS